MKRLSLVKNRNISTKHRFTRRLAVDLNPSLRVDTRHTVCFRPSIDRLRKRGPSLVAPATPACQQQLSAVRASPLPKAHLPRGAAARTTFRCTLHVCTWPGAYVCTTSGGNTTRGQSMPACAPPRNLYLIGPRQFTRDTCADVLSRR